jgi:hypothetical protein
MEGLAAITGQIIGTSLSPEMWVAVAVVVYYARSAKSYFLALLIAATALLALRFAMISGYPMRAAVFAVLALTLWSSIAWGIRAAIVKVKRAPRSSWDAREPYRVRARNETNASFHEMIAFDKVVIPSVARDL